MFWLIVNSTGMNIVDTDVSAKATRSLNFLRHCLYNASSLIKSSVYKCVVCPTLEYACPVWHPYTIKNINTLESVQRRAARWASNSKWDAISHCWSKSSDDCIQELHWPTIQQRHNYYSIQGRSFCSGQSGLDRSTF